MAASARYFDLLRETNSPCNHHLQFVESAKQRGIKPTARLFATTMPTVRKWSHRYEKHGPSSLMTLPRERHHQP
jgi:hypothetical protein